MINILIIDDEQKCVDTLRLLLKSCTGNLNILGSANSVESGIKAIQKHAGTIDIVFLDIQMPDGDGFSLLKKTDKTIEFKTIFTTAYDQYALSAIKFSALDYLLKPLLLGDLEESLEKFRKSGKAAKTESDQFRDILLHNKTFEKLAIPTLTDIHFVPLKEICYLESDKNYTTIFLADDKKIVSSKNIGYYEEILSIHGFCRIHHSYMVNVSRVKRFIKGKTGLLELENGNRLQVSASRKESLFDLLKLA